VLSATLVTRDAIPRDAHAITRVLTAALDASPMGGWLEPAQRRRLRCAQAYVGPLVEQTIRDGIVRMVVQDEKVVGAALWSLHQCAGPPAAVFRAAAIGDADRAVSLRQWRLDRFTEAHRPAELRHQQLVFLGVHPHHRGRGIGGHLLNHHHELLDDLGWPAYAVVVDGGMRDVLDGHGYSRIGRSEPLAGGVLARAMLRLPRPANSVVSLRTAYPAHVDGNNRDL